MINSLTAAVSVSLFLVVGLLWYCIAYTRSFYTCKNVIDTGVAVVTNYGFSCLAQPFCVKDGKPRTGSHHPRFSVPGSC